MNVFSESERAQRSGRRGRPRAVKKETKAYSIEEILSGQSYPLELVTTKIGGMKAAFQNHCFEFHFNRHGNKFWRCLLHTNGCTAKIMSKNNLVYSVNSEHNHQSESVLFVNTSEFIAGKTSNTSPVSETSAAPEIKTNLTLKMKQRLALKMKERMQQ